MLTIDGTKVIAGTRVLKLYQYGFTADLPTTTFTLTAQWPDAATVVIPVMVRYRDGTELVSDAAQVDLRCAASPAPEPTANVPVEGPAANTPEGGEGCAVRPAGQADVGWMPACLFAFATRLRRRGAPRVTHCRG